MLIRSSLFGLLAAAAPWNTALAQTTPYFTEHTFAPGADVNDYFMAAHSFGASGFAAADFDGDGDIDVFVPSEYDHGDLLLRKGSNGEFVNEAALLGPTDDYRSSLSVWTDVNGDRLLDLAVFTTSNTHVFGTSTLPTVAQSRPRLYIQDHAGNFTDVAASVGLYAIHDAMEAHPNGIDPGGIAAGDLNQDGLPDIFVGHTSGPSSNLAPDKSYPILSTPSGTYVWGDVLLENSRHPTWACDPAQGGIPLCAPSQDSGNCAADLSGNHWSSIVHDFDGDGLLDVFCAFDHNPNGLYLNSDSLWSGGLPTGPFLAGGTDGGIRHILDAPAMPTLQQCTIAASDMGIGVGDFDNNGHFDFYTTTVNSTTFPTDRDALLAGQPDGTFVNVAPALGLDLPSPMGVSGVGWGATFVDANLDGWEDLAIMNLALRDFFYLNDGAGGFDLMDPGSTDYASSTWGLGPFAIPTGHFNGGRAVGGFDHDRDGVPDLGLVFSPPLGTGGPGKFTILRNRYGDSNPVSWLVIRPRLIGTNSHAIDAVVRLEVTYPKAPTQRMSRVILAGEGFVTQEPYEAHFGIGSNPTSVKVTVEWPRTADSSGNLVQYEHTVLDLDVTQDLDQVLTVGWCSFADLAAPYGELDIDDTFEFLTLWAAEDLLVDFDGDGVVNANSDPAPSPTDPDLVAFNALFAQGCVTAAKPIDFTQALTCLRGDANGDGSVNIADAVTISNFLFNSGSLACEDAADANDDGNLDIADMVSVLGAAFQGSPLPAPYPACGFDRTPDSLSTCPSCHGCP